MKHEFVSLSECKLPIHEIELMEDELLLVKGGSVEPTDGDGDSGSGCGCGCGCGCQ